MSPVMAWAVFVGGKPADAYPDGYPRPVDPGEPIDGRPLTLDVADDMLVRDPASRVRAARTVADDGALGGDTIGRTWPAPAGRVNLLPPDVEGVEGVTLPAMFGNHSSGQELAVDSSWSYEGAQSLRMRAVSGATSTTGVMLVSSDNNITPGQSVVFRVAVRRGSGTAAAQFAVKWRDSAGAQLGSEQQLAVIPTTVGSVNAFEVEATAPAGAARGYPLVRWTTTPSVGQELQMDSWGVWVTSTASL